MRISVRKWVVRKIGCPKIGLSENAKLYDHVLEKVAETEEAKILWDFNIQTDHIEHRCPDVVALDKKKKCHLIDLVAQKVQKPCWGTSLHQHEIGTM